MKKRNPRKTRWTKAFRKSAGKEMKVDASFEFEKRRNRPVRYDRDLVGATIAAMRRVSEIQQTREKRYYDKRMKGVKALEKAQRAADVEKNINLVQPAALRMKKEVQNVTATVKSKAKNAPSMEIE